LRKIPSKNLPSNLPNVLPNNLQNASSNKTLWDEIVDIKNLDDAYHKSQKGKYKYKIRSIIFSQDLTYNLQQLREQLINNTYKISRYSKFIIHDPRERLVAAPHYRDKLVQISLHNKLKLIYDKIFISHSYACIEGKGTHRAVNQINKFMRKALWQWGEDTFIVKVDVKKFFYSINREILKKIIYKKIKCDKTRNLIYKIIDSSPSERGLPLGNITSQLFANIYLNEVDQYCKRFLGIKFYVRYMDDIVIILSNKQKAVEIVNLIKKFLKDRLNLEANANKTKIFPLSQGVNTIGFKIYTTHKLLRTDSKKRIKRKLSKFKKLIRDNKITIEKAETMLNSWLGHVKNCNSHNLIKKLLKKYKFLIMKNNIFKVNRKFI